MFLVVQAVLVGGFHHAKDLEPSGLELAASEGMSLVLQGTVSRREEGSRYFTYYLTDNQIRLEGQIIEESMLLVYIKQDQQQNLQQPNIAVGNRLRLIGEVQFFQEATNPGNFDQKFYYQKQGIHAGIWADEVEIVRAETWYVRERLTVLRKAWKNLLISCMGEYNGNIMSAILLGEKSELDPEVKKLYQKSGIGHILAISGLHMSFLGIGFYRLLRKGGMPFLPAGSIGILFLMLYTLMVGCGVSSLRALIMFMVRMGAEITGRTYDMPTSLSLAAAIIVFWQPLYLLDAGFLLSFGAILGILLVSPVLENFHAVPKVLCGGLGIHMMLLPIMLYYYFELPIYSLLLNLLVVPLMSVVLGIGILGSVVAPIWSSGGIAVLQVCKGILWGYEKLCMLTMRLPFGRIVPGRPGKGFIVLYYVLLFAGCMLGLKFMKDDMKKQKNGMDRKKGLARMAVIFLTVFFCLICDASHGKQGELKVTMLDVGQGDGLYVRTPFGKHYFIDGGSTDITNPGTYRMEPFLKSQGVDRLDYVFISHGDADHMNGIQELLENQLLGITIDTLVLPTESVLDDSLRELAQTAARFGTKVTVIQEGQQLADGEMCLTCLAPAKSYSGEIGNASSMVLKLKYHEFDMLFTGDVEGEGEKMLTENSLLKDCDVLKVAHHGSKNSTIGQFLEIARPEIALISAGRENRYGHPHEETIKRLENTGCQIYSTKDCGAVTLKTDGEKIRLEKYLQP